MSKKGKQPSLPPIEISGDARHALNEKVKAWTGWRNATLQFGRPPAGVSPFAETDFAKRTITINPEHTMLNPNRVLYTITPFRLRQEAVITGTLLHEAAHARHSVWMRSGNLVHSDGSAPTKQAVSLAATMEEARIEGIMAVECSGIDAHGLEWTMRAAAAKLLPPTELSSHQAQAVMDLITSWALRAGRQIALTNRTSYGTGIKKHHLPHWVGEFTTLLGEAIEAHLTQRIAAGAVLVAEGSEHRDPEYVVTETPNYRAYRVVSLLNLMLNCDDDTGPTMLDTARDAITLLFPETEDDSDSDDGEAMAGGGHGDAADESESESGDDGEGDEEGADGEGNTEPEDEGSGDEPGAGDSGDDDADPSEEDGDGDESDDQDPDGPEDQPEADEPGDGGSEDDEGDDEGDDTGDDGGEDTDEDDGASTSTNPLGDLANALAGMEKACKAQVDDEAEGEAEQAPPSLGAGHGAGGAGGGGWRMPTPQERDIQKGAERFLRNLIDTSESSARSLTDQPSATVDGAELSAWKASGQVREPRFFIRTRRSEAPSPPVEIAILVDVSASMDELAAPSALLSWALSCAAIDLRNFAGRGTQVKSTLIHWGDNVSVMQKPGEMLPGIREHDCMQGTSAMHSAIYEAERQIPGFLDPDRNVHRLLVQFTDWELYGSRAAASAVSKALAAGVNMLSVVPRSYSPGYADLTTILRMARVQRGRNMLIRYTESAPGAVWDAAADMLKGVTPAPFPGF